MKAFFSRRADRYREAYGMLNRDHDRQCVFIGTSNEFELVEATRRFWPVRLREASEIDIAHIQADRDQLWAEAVSLYRQGVQWWLAPNHEKIAAEVQHAFTEHDLWEDLISKWVQSKAATQFTMDDLFAGFMPFREASIATKADQMRAARCLTKLGFQKQYETRDGRRTMWWQKKTQESGN